MHNLFTTEDGPAFLLEGLKSFQAIFGAEKGFIRRTLEVQPGFKGKIFRT